jgi:hypothetical protein
MVILRQAITCGVYVIEWANLAATSDGRGKRLDLILEASGSVGSVLVRDLVLITQLSYSLLVNRCLYSSRS